MIAERVKASMQQKFDTDPNMKNWHLAVTGVTVLKKGGNQYQGLAKIMYKNNTHDVLVEITADWNNTLWQAPPGSFLFVVQEDVREIERRFSR